MDDAQEIAQEARLRLHARTPAPENSDAYLTKIAVNLSIDRLRRLKRERRSYKGPWLPEAIPPQWLVQSEGAPQALAEMAESLSIGFMLMLENLEPQDRVIFALRTGFDHSHREIAEVLELTEANVRQRFRRARQTLNAQQAEFGRDNTTARARSAGNKELLEKLLVAVAADDPQALTRLLTNDVISYNDGGGVVSAAIIPIEGAARVATVALHLAKKATASEHAAVHAIAIAGNPSLVIIEGKEISSVIQIDAATNSDGTHRVRRIYVLRNPQKLGAIQDWLDHQA